MTAPGRLAFGTIQGSMAGVKGTAHLRNWLSVAVLLCAGGAHGATAPVPADLESALREPLPETEYVNGERCLSSFMIDDTEVLDARRVLFHGRNGRVWLNQLRQACLGLAPDRVLEFEMHGSRICRLDSFRSLERYGLYRRSAVPDLVGGPCFLGEFEPVSEAQADVIRTSLIHARNSKRPAETAEAGSP
jgi:hypothetical protein